MLNVLNAYPISNAREHAQKEAHVCVRAHAQREIVPMPIYQSMYHDMHQNYIDNTQI